MNHFGKFALLGAVLAASASSAFATVLVPNGLFVVPGTTTTAASTGTLAGSTGGSQVSSTGSFSDTWTESVYRGASGNTFGINDLTFVFNFTNSASSSDNVSLAAESYFNLAGILVDADYIAGTGAVPQQVNLTSSGTVNFAFAGVTPGQSADTLVLYTNATALGTGTFGLHDGSATTSTDLAPALATPEPNSLILLGTGLVGAAGMLFRRRQTV